MDKSKEWYEMVFEFHRRFGHPHTQLGKKIPMGILEATNRGAWIVEEAIEWVGTEHMVKQVDSIIDMLYFCWGCFVIIGDMPQLKWPHVNGDVPVQLNIEERKIAALDINWIINELVNASAKKKEVADSQLKILSRVAQIGLDSMGRMNIDPATPFEIVHESNMGKLWPDGMPRYYDNGKIQKPPTYEPPEFAIRDHLIEIITERIEGEPEDLPF